MTMQLALPVQTSFRFGSFIEVNPLGDKKLCSYDCPYCFLGPTEVRMNQIKKSIPFPSIDDIEKALRDQMNSAESLQKALDMVRGFADQLQEKGKMWQHKEGYNLCEQCGSKQLRFDETRYYSLPSIAW